MLPEQLEKKLKKFERRLFVVESIVFVCGGLLGVFVSFLVLFASDRFWDTPMVLRFILTLFGCLVFGAACAWWAHHWLIRRRDPKSLAKLVQRGMTGIGDRLLGAVELAEGKNLPANVSPSLCQAAIDQVAEQMKDFDFESAVKKRSSGTLALAMVVCAVLVSGLFVFVRPAFENSLKRWSRPAAAVPRYTFVSIEDLPDQLVVPHGEGFPINIKLKKDTAWRPEMAVCQFEDQEQITAAITNGYAEFELPGQVAEGNLLVRLGDVKRSIWVVPVFRPELLELNAEIDLPDYLGYSMMSQKIKSGKCELLAGSRVRFKGKASRGLESAAAATAAGRLAVDVEGPDFETDAVDASSVSNCVFTWRDIHGLTPRQPYTVRAVEVEDAPPSVECRGIGRSVAILEDEVLEIEAIAEDDFGLKNLRLNWFKGGDSDSSEEALLAEGTRQERSLSGNYIFSPIANNIPEETVVTMFASARDYRPGVKPAHSAVHKIYVLSKASHAKLMKDMMERVQNRVEEMLHAERALKDSNEKLSEMDDKELSSRKGDEETRKNEYREQEQARKLENISRDMKDLAKEIMRNSEIDTETVKSWLEMMDAMQKLSQKEIKQAVESMRSASSDQQDRKQKLEEAVALEEEIIEQLKKNAGKMGDTLDQMMARNFVNRLKQLAATQKQVGDTAKDILPKSVGMDPENLPDEVKSVIVAQESMQVQIKKEAGYIYDDIGGYYNRTRKPVYDRIRTEMADMSMSEALQDLRNLISDNLTVSVIKGAGEWSAQFKLWADMLAKKSGEEGESGEPEELSEHDLEVLIELYRLRQGEEQLREQTRVLDERREENVRYASDARKLAKKQSELGKSTLNLQRKVRNDKLKQLLEKIDGEMLNAQVYLRRPQTDADTIAIQTEIIELLSASVSECSGQASGAAMLMQMMGGGGSGGSYAGGTTDDANIDFENESSGQDFESKSVGTVGGADEDWPEEFRDVLDAYHRALEKE